MIIFKNSRSPIHILSGEQLDKKVNEFMDGRERHIALALALYLKGEPHREFGPAIKKVLDDFRVKEAVDAFSQRDKKK